MMYNINIKCEKDRTTITKGEFLIMKLERKLSKMLKEKKLTDEYVGSSYLMEVVLLLLENRNNRMTIRQATSKIGERHNISSIATDRMIKYALDHSDWADKTVKEATLTLLYEMEYYTAKNADELKVIDSILQTDGFDFTRQGTEDLRVLCLNLANNPGIKSMNAQLSELAKQYKMKKKDGTPDCSILIRNIRVAMGDTYAKNCKLRDYVFNLVNRFKQQQVAVSVPRT